MQCDALEAVKRRMPKLNHLVCEGLAYHQMKRIEFEIDRLMKIAFRRDGERVGDGLPDAFRYVDFEYVTPEESYMERVKNVTKQSGKGKNSHALNMARTDSYLVRFIFENDGRTIDKYLSIPFVRRGGITHVNGVPYGISPVIKTRGLSLTSKGYFIDCGRHRVNIEQLTEQFLINGTVEHIYMPFSTNLHKTNDKRKTNLPALAYWLFAKFGLQGTFKLYGDAEIEVYHTDDPYLTTLDTEEYAVCKADPNTRGESPQLAIVIKKELLTPSNKILLGSAFYIARNNPTRVLAEYVDDPTLWQVLLGFSIFGKGSPEARIVEDIRSHFANVEAMMDEKFHKELLTEQIFCDTMYDFFHYVIVRTTERTGNEMASMARLWGRYYTTTDYVISGLRESIFTTRYQLIKLARKTNGRPLPTNLVMQTINTNLKRDKIHGINDGTHGEISTFMTATDNMFIGLTSHCIDQTQARKSPGNKKGFDLNDPSKHLHSSIAEVGSLANLPKSSPFGPDRINGHVEISPAGRILEKEKFRGLMRMMDADFRQKGV